MACLSKAQVATLLGIRHDTFKKNLRAGVYTHIVSEDASCPIHER
jgi:hypothetical protein